MEALELKGTVVMVTLKDPKVVYTHAADEEMEIGGFTEVEEYIDACVRHDQSKNPSTTISAVKLVKTWSLPKKKA